MSATTAAVNPAVPPPSAPARSSAHAAASDGQGRFDRHLDAARQRHDRVQDKPAQDDTDAKPATKAESNAAPEHPQATDAAAKAPENPEAAALAAAMLALIGQAAPHKPLALANAVTHAATKAVAAAPAGTTAASALALLTGTAGAPTGKANPELDISALAPTIAKPAEQKDGLLEAMQPVTTAAAPMTAPATTATVAPSHTLSIASPAGTPAFAQELGQHVAWLGQQDVKQARIRLHPEELGSLDVRVSINHDRVDVSFAVQHPGAVHAVQQTLPQLDTLLAQHGLSLGQADVGQRQQQGDGGRGGEGAGAIGEIEADTGLAMNMPVAALGLLDTFA